MANPVWDWVARALLLLGVVAVAGPFVQRATTGDYPRWSQLRGAQKYPEIIEGIIEEAEDKAQEEISVAAPEHHPQLTAQQAEEPQKPDEQPPPSTLQDWQISGPTEFLVYLGRTLRITAVVFLTVADYKANFMFLDEEAEPEAWAAARLVVDRRCARRLRKLCSDYGGIFIKAAQMLSTMSHMIPPAYSEEFAHLQDSVPPSPLEAVEMAFLEEFGKLPVEVFREFDSVPVASASIAQVHRAVRQDGVQVAVKVQYPHITKQIHHAMRVLKPQLELLGRRYPKWDMTWVLEEFRRSMTQELDFECEADNARRIATLFEGRDDVYVPWTDPELSTRRVLTMEWVSGIKVDQVDKIRALGLEPLQVADLFTRTFTEMTFRFGFVHADPHPANVWVTKNAAGRPKLILLDHGLYQELGQEFRLNYCRLWRSLFKQDAAELEASSRALGLEKYTPQLPLMLTFRPLKGTKLGQADQEELKQQMVAAFSGDFNPSKFLQTLPPQLLFLLKVNHLIRHTNRQLGGTTRDRLRLTFRAAVQGIWSSTYRDYDPVSRQMIERGASMTFGQRLSYHSDMLMLELGFQLFENRDRIVRVAYAGVGVVAFLGLLVALLGRLRFRSRSRSPELMAPAEP